MDRLGPYVLEGELGRGGMGVVYRARDSRTGEPVAVKTIRVEAGDDPRARARFLTELQALKHLDHPSVVKLIDAGEEGEVLYGVMDLLEGTTLEEHLDGKGALSPQRTVELGIALAEGLEAAHRLGILHRDLKPDNVFLCADGSVRLTDFGLGRIEDQEQSDRLTQSGSLLGTPLYMAPEQAVGEGKSATSAVDVYGLGAVLYAALTRVPPIQATSLVELVEATRVRPPTPPSELNPDVDPALSQVILRCLNKAPEERYPSAAAVGEALAAWREKRAASPLGAFAVAGLGVALALAIGLALVRAEPVAEEGKPTAPWIVRGWTALERHDVSGAASAVEEASAAGPLTPAGRELRAAVRLRREDWSGALEDLDAVIAAEESARAFLLRAQARYGACDWAGALTDAERAGPEPEASEWAARAQLALGLESNSPVALRDAAERLEGLLRLPSADARYVDPDLLVPYVHARIASDSVSAALTELARLRGGAPDDRRCALLEAHLQQLAGDASAARRTYDAVALVAPEERGGMLRLRALSWAQEGKLSAARQDLVRSLAAERPEAQGYSVLWLAALGGDRGPLTRLAEEDSALGELARLVEDEGRDLLGLAPGDVALAHALLGVLAERRGAVEDARAHYARARTLETALHDHYAFVAQRLRDGLEPSLRD
jgi:hypothetical protein